MMNTISHFGTLKYLHIMYRILLTYVAHYLNNKKSGLNLKQAGLFADWYGRGRADSAPPPCNFCLYGPLI